MECPPGQPIARDPAQAAVGRAFEDELEPPPLSPVPVRLATDLEVQLAEVLGLETRKVVPRLPRDVVSCSHGSKCCWRWLARAALEHVSGMPAEHLGLSHMVAALREELEFLRMDRQTRCEDRDRAEIAQATLAELQRAHMAAERELTELRPLPKEVFRLQTDAAEFRVINGRLEAQKEAGLREMEQLRREQAVAVEGGIAAAEKRAASLEHELEKARSDERTHTRELELYVSEIKRHKEEIEGLKARLAAKQADKKKRNGTPKPGLPNLALVSP